MVGDVESASLLSTASTDVFVSGEGENGDRDDGCSVEIGGRLKRNSHELD